MYSGAEIALPVTPSAGTSAVRCINCSGLGYASGRSSTPFTIVNMAVLAPMPNARVSTRTAVKPGFLTNMRKAWRTSRPISSRRAP